MTRALGISLWCLFALLVLAGGGLFLRACGTQPSFPWARNFCPVPRDRDMRREAETGQDLRRQVHLAEMQLAEIPPCPPPAPRPVVPPHPAPEDRSESGMMDRRLEREHGNRGRLQFTLSWDTTDDLDINVDCPGGQISGFPGHRGPGICGDGVKDVDANGELVRNVSSSPVENVTWEDDIPDGTYTITIIEYAAKSDRGNTVPFILRMRWGDEEKICHGFVEQWPPSRFHREQGKLINGTYRTLTWVKGDPLPDCNFEVLESMRGGPHK